MTPTDGSHPTYRAYVVVESEPGEGEITYEPHTRPDEIAYVLAAFPEVLRQIPGMEPGGVMRL
jgi:hypothetical protein